MIVKLKDIAEKAGVSVSTASNALNGYTKSRISQETLERVTRIATEMGYRPNAIARSLKFQRTDTIAFYTGYGYCDVRDRFLGEIVTGMQNACDQSGIDLLLYGNLARRPIQEIQRRLMSGKMDGLVVHAGPDDPVINLIADQKLPAVAVADIQSRIPSIVANDASGMEMLVEYIWSKGHRRIAFSGPHLPFASVEARRDAFVRAVRSKGAEPIMMEVPWRHTAEFLTEFMRDPNRPSVIFSWHDDSAYYLLDYCIRLGIRVPEDLAVVGFDGLLEGRIPGRKLVTIGVPWREMATKAADLLVNLRDGESVEPIMHYPVSFVPGDTA